MYDGHTIGVVVPAYNEEGFVGKTIDTIPSFVDRVFVIDDASTDGTWKEIEAHASALNEARSSEAPGFERPVVTIRHDENRGVGGAIKTGYRRALAEGVDITAVMGGDNQMNPAELHRYVKPIARGDADYVKGSRFVSRRDWEEMPRFRLVGNVLLSYLTKVSSGYWKILDPQNGYTAISLEALRRIDLEEMYEYYGYCNDLLVKLNVENLRVADVPRSSTFAYEDGWKSHIDYGEYVPRVSWMLLRNFFFRLNRKYLFRDFHPLALFYYLGVALVGVGLVRLGGGLASRRVKTNADEPSRSADWILLAGTVLVIHAATLDAENNRDLEELVVPALDERRPEYDDEHATREAIAADGGSDR